MVQSPPLTTAAPHWYRCSHGPSAGTAVPALPPEGVNV